MYHASEKRYDSMNYVSCGNSGLKLPIGTLITTGKLGNGFVPGLIAELVMVAVVVGLIHKTNKQFASEYELKKAV